MAIKICQFLTTLTTLTLIILFLEMLKFSKLINYSIDMCQSYQGITIVKFLHNGGTDPHKQKCPPNTFFKEKMDATPRVIVLTHSTIPLPS
jgi:hypothetical protein